mmetsp:Transcript_35884/g.62351  ORF Transcript_35884/g.62351 Transcript_35884/m.62351 type:complete len:97 (+) Transcript_35884:3-293(+)
MIFDQEEHNTMLHKHDERHTLLYKVIADAVKVRSRPALDGEELGVHVRSHIIEVLSVKCINDSSWAQVVSNGQEQGWMLMESPQMGTLLEPVQSVG